MAGIEILVILGLLWAFNSSMKGMLIFQYTIFHGYVALVGLDLLKQWLRFRDHSRLDIQH
jgi:hypothetical protein